LRNSFFRARQEERRKKNDGSLTDDLIHNTARYPRAASSLEFQKRRRPAKYDNGGARD